MALIAFVAPILPGKREQWDRFTGELNGARHSEFEAANRRAGVRERTFLQEAPDGTELVIVTLEGDEPETAKVRAANEDTDFARWFVQQVQEIHGFDLREPLPAPTFVAETDGAVGAQPSAGWAQIIKMHLKAGREHELLQVLGQVRDAEQPGSGWVRSITGREQKDPSSIYSLALFESEEKARARERDPQRQQLMQSVMAQMAEMSDSPREFVNLDIVHEATAASTTQDNIKLFRRLVDEIINGQDLSGFDEMFAPDFVEHEEIPGMPEGRELARQLFAALHAAFPDIHAEIEDIVAQDDKVVVRMTWDGTQTGEFMGIPPTGKRATWQVFDIVRFVEGKGVEHWGLMDQMSLMGQLGAIPAAETVGS